MKHQVKSLLASVAILGGAVALSACSSTPVEPPKSEGGGTTTTQESTVTIGGKEFTCEDIVNGACDDALQGMFDTYKDNLVAYLTSGKLSAEFTASDGGSATDAAYGGLAACIYMDQPDGQNQFITLMNQDDKMMAHAKDFGNVAFLPLWFEASNSLCPGLASTAPGYQTRDFITP